MHFMKCPPRGKEVSSPFTLKQLEIATGSVDKLVSFGVLALVPFGADILNTCPLFLVPKSGQPGQWRFISDMEKGGHNDVCVSDPVSLPQPGGILSHLYTDVW
jgi:hypothetical protein